MVTCGAEAAAGADCLAGTTTAGAGLSFCCSSRAGSMEQVRLFTFATFLYAAWGAPHPFRVRRERTAMRTLRIVTLRFDNGATENGP